MLNLKYERVTAADLKPGELFATVDNPGVRALQNLPVVNVGAPEGAIGFGHFHVRTEEPIRDQSDAEAPCYRVTVEVL
ncbi:MAG: hypothetical protein ABW208_07325 [Pyrinomonadaceae bacterium]